MGLFDRSKSTTTQETTNIQDIDTQQISSEGGGTSIGASGSGVVNLQTTDLGAVDSAFDFADRFGGGVLDLLGRVTKQTSDFAGDLTGDAIEKVGAAQRSDTTETFRKVALYAAIAVAVIFISLSLRKRG